MRVQLAGGGFWTLAANVRCVATPPRFRIPDSDALRAVLQGVALSRAGLALPYPSDYGLMDAIALEEADARAYAEHVAASSAAEV